MGRAPARLDPRLPDGRTGDHLLRPWAAARVPGRAGGHGRRHSRRLVVAAIIAVAAIGPERAPRSRQVASGGINPLKYRMLVDNVSALVHRAPDLRRRGPADRRAGVALPRSWPGAGPADACQGRDRPRRAGCCSTLPLRGKQAELSARLESKRQEVERALEYVELYGLYTECEAIYQVDNLLAHVGHAGRGRPGRVQLRPALGRLADATSTTSTCRRSSSTPASRPTPGQDARTDRMGRMRRRCSIAKRHVAAFDLENTLIASNVVESYSWLATRRLDSPERVRYVLRTIAEAPGLLQASTVPTAPTSCATSTAATRMPRSSRSRPTRSELLTQVIITKSFPAGLRRVREHRALGHRTVLITGALSFAVEGLRPLFDEIVAAEMSIEPDGTLLGRDGHRAADRRGTGPDPGRLLRRRGVATRGVASPTPTRTSTCRCSRPSASPWPSTPRPGSPRSPASAAGSSSTGPRHPARAPPLAPDRPADVRTRTPPGLPMTGVPRAVRARARSAESGLAIWARGRWTLDAAETPRRS